MRGIPTLINDAPTIARTSSNSQKCLGILLLLIMITQITFVQVLDSFSAIEYLVSVLRTEKTAQEARMSGLFVF